MGSASDLYPVGQLVRVACPGIGLRPARIIRWAREGHKARVRFQSGGEATVDKDQVQFDSPRPR